jgi:PKD repeat protein
MEGWANFTEINPNWGTVCIVNPLYNDAVLHDYVASVLWSLDGTQHERQFTMPQYAVPSGNYLARVEDLPQGFASLDLPLNVLPGKAIIFDFYPPRTIDLESFTFSIVAQYPLHKTSYSDLFHAAGAITVNVSTETLFYPKDWWGSFVLPDTVTVAAARSYDGTAWYDLDELYDYTINPVDGYKIVVVRISPETEQLMLKYSPVSIPVLAFYPPEVDIPLDSTKTVNLTLSSAPNGLSGYNLTASLSNSSVAEILSVNFPDWATLYDNSMLPSDSVWIKATDLNDRIKRGGSNISLATLIIRGDKQGKSDIFINVTKIDDDDGNPIYPITIPGQVTVVPSCGITVPSCANPPTDPDNDGLCEDTNGNVRKDFYDVIVFFKNLEWVEKNQPIECYDFNKNGHIDFDDIVKLFEEI